MATLVPTRLRTEGLDTPLAIDEAKPRLSWIVNSDDRDATQGAWRITAAATPEDLEGGTDLLWDSGRVEGDDTVHVEWDGAALPSHQAVHWQVQSWDAEGVAGPVSDIAHFRMGLLTPRDWTGKYIGFKAPNVPEPVCARRAFQVDAGLVSATLAITAQGVHEPWLNGRRVGEDFFQPGWTDYRRRRLYTVYDLSLIHI